jgi:hypothetical protein
MDIASFSGAASVALASTIVFVLVSRFWQILLRAVASAPSFADNVMREAAQRFRDEFERLSDTQAAYLSAALVFAVLFVAAYVLDADRLFAGYPSWQLHIFLVALVAGGLVAGCKLARTIWQRGRVRLLRDANIAVGHRLHGIATGFGRVYHDVETAAGVIDHVIVGTSGAYAVHVVARRPGRDGSVALEGNQLVFSSGGRAESLVPIAKRNDALEREFRRLLDRRVRVRSVIAAPGWQVNESTGEDHLVVNDKSLSILTGWKDRADCLMTEDADALQQMLARGCSRTLFGPAAAD